MKKKAIWISLTLVVVLVLSVCQTKEDTTESTTQDHSLPYLNLHDSVGYVGMSTCKSCHSEQHGTFIHTGMGRSFGPAEPWRSDAVFDKHALVYDDALDMYYRPYWQDSILIIEEFRISSGDTVHQRTETVAYIIGSGNHTNSHLIDENGFVYQAPITFYTQEGKWDLAPGFEAGNNSRFSRLIGLECMSCHNGYPEFESSSENRFISVPFGIDCERCHGPGEVHVRKMLAGNIVDTATEIDYSIVNPANLPRDFQMDICQRCHLQGVAVLNPGKSFYDFKPGMRLKEVMNIFLPRFEGEEDLFIMASQADRLRMSECYINSDMSCITCHNPHVSVKETPVTHFNNTCSSCHASDNCSVEEQEFLLAEGNCVGCHMPPSSSIDIPHVSITDHYIRKDYTGKAYSLGSEQSEMLTIGEMSLECLTDETPSDLTMTRGYLAFYERFHQDELMLDSASMYLESAKGEKLDEAVHLAYLREDMQAIRDLAQQVDTNSITDPWTAYRIGEAYQAVNDYGKVLPFFARAYHLMPLNLRFTDKYATALYKASKPEKALNLFEELLSLQPRVAKHWYNIGYYYLMKPDYEKAGLYLKKSLQLNPDYEAAQSALDILAIQSGMDK